MLQADYDQLLRAHLVPEFFLFPPRQRWALVRANSITSCWRVSYILLHLISSDTRCCNVAGMRCMDIWNGFVGENLELWASMCSRCRRSSLTCRLCCMPIPGTSLGAESWCPRPAAPRSPFQPILHQLPEGSSKKHATYSLPSEPFLNVQFSSVQDTYIIVYQISRSFHLEKLKQFVLDKSSPCPLLLALGTHRASFLLL